MTCMRSSICCHLERSELVHASAAQRTETRIMDFEQAVPTTTQQRNGAGPAAGSSPVPFVETRGRLSRRSSSLGIQTSSAIELVVSDLGIDEETVRALGNMAIDDERRSEMRRSFTVGKRVKRSSPLSGSNTPIATSTPRRSSMGSIDFTSSASGERRAERFGPSLSLTASISLREPVENGNISPQAAPELSDWDDSGESCRRSHSTTSSIPSGLLTHSRSFNTENSHDHVQQDASGTTFDGKPPVQSADSASACSNGHGGSRTQRRLELLQRRSSQLARGDRFGDGCPISPISEASVETMSASPVSSLEAASPEPTPEATPASPVSPASPASPPPPPPLPPPEAPPFPDSLLDEQPAENGRKSGTGPRRKTIAVVDENSVELDEALDVIREQETEITVLQYQLEALKDQFEELEMSQYEDEKLLHQAQDLNGKLQHDLKERNEQVKGYSMMGRFLQDLLQPFNIVLPKADALNDEAERAGHLQHAQLKLRQAVERHLSEEQKASAAAAAVQQPPATPDGGSRSRSASISVLSLPTSLLSRVRTPDWMNSQRSPSPVRRLTRESSVDPPDLSDSRSGTHVSRSATPVSRSGTPVSRSGTPVSRSGTPVSRSGTPVRRQQDSLAAARKQAPVTSGNRSTQHMQFVRHSSVDPPFIRSSDSPGHADSPLDNRVAKDGVTHRHSNPLPTASASPDQASSAGDMLPASSASDVFCNKAKHGRDYAMSNDSTPPRVSPSTAATHNRDNATSSGATKPLQSVDSPRRQASAPPGAADTASNNKAPASSAADSVPRSVSTSLGTVACNGGIDETDSIFLDSCRDIDDSDSMLEKSQPLDSMFVTVNTVNPDNTRRPGPAQPADPIPGKKQPADPIPGKKHPVDPSPVPVRAGAPSVATSSQEVVTDPVIALLNATKAGTRNRNRSFDAAVQSRPPPPARKESIPVQLAPERSHPAVKLESLAEHTVVQTIPPQERAEAKPAPQQEHPALRRSPQQIIATNTKSGAAMATQPGQAAVSSVRPRHEYTAAMPTIPTATTEGSRRGQLLISDSPSSAQPRMSASLTDPRFVQHSLHHDTAAQLGSMAQHHGRHRPVQHMTSQPISGTAPHHGPQPSIDDMIPGGTYKSPYARRRSSMESLQPLADSLPASTQRPGGKVTNGGPPAVRENQRAGVSTATAAAATAKVETQV